MPARVFCVGDTRMTRAAGLVAALGAAALPFATPSVAQDAFANFTPVTDAMLANPAPADWPMWRRTSNSWGYSPLEEINRRNVAQLSLVWSRPLADGSYQEGTALVVGASHRETRVRHVTPSARTCRS